VILVLGISSDKDIGGIVAEAASLSSEVIVASSRNPRAAKPAVLVNEFSKLGVVPQVAESVASAMRLALGRATTSDLICAAGSLFVVAEVMEYMAELD
jgi:dihydrofolate synthase/folylpolyglutamate synthase